MTDKPTPIPTRLGAAWVELAAANQKLRTLLDAAAMPDDAVTYAVLQRTAVTEAKAAAAAYLEVLVGYGDNLGRFLAQRAEIGTEAAPL